MIAIISFFLYAFSRSASREFLLSKSGFSIIFYFQDADDQAGPSSIVGLAFELFNALELEGQGVRHDARRGVEER